MKSSHSSKKSGFLHLTNSHTLVLIIILAIALISSSHQTTPSSLAADAETAACSNEAKAEFQTSFSKQLDQRKETLRERIEKLSFEKRQPQFGLPTDKPVAADYDGDGRADIAVYRSGAWYYQKSTNNNQLVNVQFGMATDITVPAAFIP